MKSFSQTTCSVSSDPRLKPSMVRFGRVLYITVPYSCQHPPAAQIGTYTVLLQLVAQLASWPCAAIFAKAGFGAEYFLMFLSISSQRKLGNALFNRRNMHYGVPVPYLLHIKHSAPMRDPQMHRKHSESCKRHASLGWNAVPSILWCSRCSCWISPAEGLTLPNHVPWSATRPFQNSVFQEISGVKISTPCRCRWNIRIMYIYIYTYIWAISCNFVLFAAEILKVEARDIDASWRFHFLWRRPPRRSKTIAALLPLPRNQSKLQSPAYLANGACGYWVQHEYQIILKPNLHILVACNYLYLYMCICRQACVCVRVCICVCPQRNAARSDTGQGRGIQWPTWMYAPMCTCL